MRDSLIFLWRRHRNARQLSGKYVIARDELARLRAVRDERRRALLDALGMDPLRDWDDIVNAARCIRKQRDEQRATAERVRITLALLRRGAVDQPDDEFRAGRLHAVEAVEAALGQPAKEEH